MFADTKVFSAFAVDDLAQARKFYGETLALSSRAALLGRSHSWRCIPGQRTSQQITGPAIAVDGDFTDQPLGEGERLCAN